MHPETGHSWGIFMWHLFLAGYRAYASSQTKVIKQFLSGVVTQASR